MILQPALQKLKAILLLNGVFMKIEKKIEKN